MNFQQTQNMGNLNQNAYFRELIWKPYEMGLKDPKILVYYK